MEKQPKVSVIIPVYNAEEYLRQCLDSVVNQTLTDIEIICVDDGSTDGSIDILRQYSEKTDRVKVLRQENLGAGFARNNGMKEAKGRYIAFLDSDDLYPDNTVLQALYDAANSNGALICGGSVQFLRKGKLVQAELQGVQYYFTKDSWVDYRDCQQDFYYQRFLFDRNMLLENNLVFPPYRRYQDPPFFVRTMLTAGQFYAISKVVYTYREGVSYRSWDAEKVFDRLKGVTEELDITRDAGLDILHARIVGRIKGIYDHATTILREDEAEKIKEAFGNVRSAVNLKLARKANRDIDLGFLDSYLGMPPKVSVIIPVYNVENYLAQCLDSIINQTLREIEIICVNDGSTDGSLEILEEYAKKDHRITIITQPNGGLSCARNTGTRAAHGEYIYFIDSDDYIEKEALEFLYREAVRDELDVLFFDGESFYEPPEYKKNFPGADCCWRPLEFGGVMSGTELYVKMREKGVFRPMVWLQLIRREYLEYIGLSFYEGLLHEDILFTIQSTLQADRVSHRNVPFYHYRRRMGAITGPVVVFERVRSKCIILNHLIAYMKDHDFGDAVNLHMARYLKWLYEEMRREYQKLSDSELLKLKSISPTEQLHFEIMTHGKAELKEPEPPKRPVVIQPKQIPQIIVSMTTYPARISAVHLVVQSLLRQTMKPDKILLYLAREEFQDEDIPEKLSKLVGEKFEIIFCDNLKPHKKYFYAMQSYPNAIVITVDDDVNYALDLVEELVASYCKYPEAVSCMRGHTIKMYDEETFAPYSKWQKEPKIAGEPSFLTVPTGVGGVLYPPHCMVSDLFNEEFIRNTCIDTDDLWLKWMQLRANTPCVLVKSFVPLRLIDGTQDTALWLENVNEKRNDRNWRLISEFDGGRSKTGDLICEKLYFEYKKRFLDPICSKSGVNQNAVVTLRRQADHYKNEVEQIKLSLSFRIGRAVTFIPRKVRGGIRCYREHGMRYTLHRLLIHLHLKKDE